MLKNIILPLLVAFSTIATSIPAEAKSYGGGYGGSYGGGYSSRSYSSPSVRSYSSKPYSYNRPSNRHNFAKTPKVEKPKQSFTKPPMSANNKNFAGNRNPTRPKVKKQTPSYSRASNYIPSSSSFVNMLPWLIIAGSIGHSVGEASAKSSTQTNCNVLPPIRLPEGC